MVPIYKIIDFNGNIYLISRAVMKRARQINFIGDEELETFDGKIASLSLKQILNDEVKYILQKEGQDKET
jgi:DNA-directed RNA polymerase subunit K/omega